jgi:hypothetical protein
VSNLPEHTVRYHSSRREVWNWYWKAWRQKLWIFHVFIAALLTFTISGSNGIGNIAVCFVVTFSISTFLMAAGAQVLFKRAERTLRVTPAGWHTQIGKRVGSRPWTKVSSVKEDAGNIIITGKNQNALIVPLRAFPNASFRQQFLEDIQDWHRKARA